MKYALYWRNQNISDYVSSITWAGNLQQTCRTLNVTLVSQCKARLGDRVRFDYYGRTLFAGLVMYIDESRDATVLECYDLGVYLANNSVFGEYVGTAQSITQQVCSSLNMPCGNLFAKTEETKVTSSSGMKAFAVIEEAYEGKMRKRKQYVYAFEPKGYLTIFEAGTQLVADIRSEIISAKRKDSIKEMVNVVHVLGEDDALMMQVQNEEQRRVYGAFAQVYKVQKDKDPATYAQDMLRGPSVKASVSAVGNSRCKSGYAVRIYEPHSRMRHWFMTITSDRHTFRPGGEYIMDLELVMRGRENEA